MMEGIFMSHVFLQILLQFKSSIARAISGTQLYVPLSDLERYRHLNAVITNWHQISIFTTC